MTAATPRAQRRLAGLSDVDGGTVPPAAADDPWRAWPIFALHLEQAIDAGDAALLRLDLLDLTDLEGTYGPQAISALRAVTFARLETFVRSRGMVIADGGARFAAFIAGLDGPDEIARVAEQMCAVVTAPTVVLGQTLHPAGCVGAAHVAPGCAVATVRSRAEAALEEARRAGTAAYRLFSPAMLEGIRSRTVLRQALQQAIADRQFRLHYQPLVRLSDRGLIGAEALARWKHPDLGMQAPAQFIPAAEETGLIVPLGAQVLEMALGQVRAWRDSGRGAPRVAVNVSALQIHRPDFARVVSRALAKAGVPPALLELELTEGTLIESSLRTIAMLAELAGMGVTLAVDDFGTGYSSLRYLRDLPVHKLKIDQTFVHNLAADSRDASIVAAVVAMARGLGLSTTAEGVQTEAQYRQLRDVGCDHGQGWLFGAPVALKA